MTLDIVTRVEEDGIEFYTVNATGESGLSQSGLIRLCDIPAQTVRDLLNNLHGNKAPQGLEPLLGKALTLTETYRHQGGLVKIVRAEVCAAVIMHYAFKGWSS